jgi:hypothetical protein
MKYRLIITPALELSTKNIVFQYKTAEQMIVAKDTAASLLLFVQDEIKAMKDYSNMFVMEEFIDDEWEEYEEW